MSVEIFQPFFYSDGKPRMFRDDGNLGMGLPIAAGPAILLKPAHYPDALAFMSQVVAVFRQP
jgi:hypothetical protein